MDEPLSERINVRLTRTLRDDMEKQSRKTGVRISDVTRRLWMLWSRHGLDPFAQPLAQTDTGDKENRHDAKAD